jgi:hypothetical protein
MSAKSGNRLLRIELRWSAGTASWLWVICCGSEDGRSPSSRARSIRGAERSGRRVASENIDNLVGARECGARGEVIA